jgi:hypothetical protein
MQSFQYHLLIDPRMHRLPFFHFVHLLHAFPSMGGIWTVSGGLQTSFPACLATRFKRRHHYGVFYPTHDLQKQILCGTHLSNGSEFLSNWFQSPCKWWRPYLRTTYFRLHQNLPTIAELESMHKVSDHVLEKQIRPGQASGDMVTAEKSAQTPRFIPV